jgi:hypothetical protein
MDNNILDYYPQNILEDANRYRSIKILVKKSNTLSGGAQELKSKLEKAAEDVKKIAENTDKFLKGETKDLNVHQSQREKLLKLETEYGLALHLPNELSDSQSHNWTSTEGLVGSTAGSALEGVQKIVGEATSRSGMRKMMIDPGYFQDYKGTEPREFTFTWEFVPNNNQEAESIYNILLKLKKYTLPTSQINGLTLLSPYLFELQIGNEKINTLMNMTNLVCKSMNINYSVDNSLQMFDDGTPKYMRLDMTFAERITVTADMY